MIGIIVAAHGEFSGGIKSAVTLIAGDQKQFETVSLREGDSVEKCKESLNVKALEVNDGNGVVIFTDLFGATPANIAAYSAKEDIIVIAGVNLPMILEILAVRNSMDVITIAQMSVEAGKNSIVNLNELLKKLILISEKLDEPLLSY